jgi:hypothetical protein
MFSDDLDNGAERLAFPLSSNFEKVLFAFRDSMTPERM